MRCKPRAIIFPDHLPDQAFCFHDPVDTLVGDHSDWQVLTDFLSEYSMEGGCDDPVPPGALVGGFTYEGQYYFEAYDTDNVEVVSRDCCLPDTTPAFSPQEISWDERVSREQYCQMVEAAREQIAAGDIYQVNLARSFETTIEALDPYEFFKTLVWKTQAPLAAMIPFQYNEEFRWICSSSPELFFRIDGTRVTTRPIKGTRPRDRDPMRDRQNAFELRTSDKEIAELVMITDLERNDLGRICKYGSVHVPDLLHAEAFSHVHHLISTVEGQLRPGVDPVAAVRACFPGGSITGAPKKRSMEIIEQLELEPRGIYTGAIGYFGFDGTAQFNIAIRTCEIMQQRMKFFTGSGITWDSDADQEFEETCHKAQGMKEAFNAYASTLNFQYRTSNSECISE